MLNSLERFELGAKLAAATAFGAYLCGFIVTAVHAARLGYPSPALVDAQYFIAGALALVPPVAVWALVAFVWEDRAVLDSRERRRSDMIALALAVLVSVISLVMVVDHWDRLEAWPIILRIAVVGILGAIATGFVGGVVWLNSELQKQLTALFLAGAMSVGSIAFYLVTFTGLVYSHVPARYGGGRPRYVNLVADTANVRSLRHLGIRFQNCCRSDRVLLAFANDQFYVVLVGFRRTPTIISSELVAGVQFGPDSLEWTLAPN
jgi:hypothetical protein